MDEPNLLLLPKEKRGSGRSVNSRQRGQGKWRKTVCCDKLNTKKNHDGTWHWLANRSCLFDVVVFVSLPLHDVRPPNGPLSQLGCFGSSVNLDPGPFHAKHTQI